MSRPSTTIVRIFATYKPLTFFWLIALFFLLLGAVSGGWYFAYKLIGQGAGHIQSAVLAAASVTVGLILFMLGFLADRLVRYKIPRTIRIVRESLRDDAGKTRRSRGP